jgi:hypothetical protein
MQFALAFVALWAINVFWSGYVASTLWEWFAVPLGVPPITFWHAAGLGALLSVFLGARGLPQVDKSEAGATLLLGFVYSVFIPLLSLAAGWIAHVNM